MTRPIGPGAFIAVTGASGVGKDTLIDAVRDSGPDLAYFPRRVITRPAGPGEDYASLTLEQFLSCSERGEFAVEWQAHGLSYGLPAISDHAIRGGGVVVANVSRNAIDALRTRYERVLLVRVTASNSVRAARLEGRRRETDEQIALRMARPDPSAHLAPDYEIDNSGSISEGRDRLMHIIETARTELMAPR